MKWVFFLMIFYLCALMPSHHADALSEAPEGPARIAVKGILLRVAQDEKQVQIHIQREDGNQDMFVCKSPCLISVPSTLIYQHVLIETDRTHELQNFSGAYGPLLSIAPDTTSKPIPSIFKTVTIRGTFADWSDKNKYKTWRVSIEHPTENNEEKNRKTFPVSADGSFKIILHDVPADDGYYLKSRAGGQRFSIFSEDVYIDTIGPDEGC